VKAHLTYDIEYQADCVLLLSWVICVLQETVFIDWFLTYLLSNHVYAHFICLMLLQ
jgi:hypothetical protein